MNDNSNFCLFETPRQPFKTALWEAKRFILLEKTNSKWNDVIKELRVVLEGMKNEITANGKTGGCPHSNGRHHCWGTEPSPSVKAALRQIEDNCAATWSATMQCQVLSPDCSSCKSNSPFYRIGSNEPNA
ncbi:hypothetical protein D918_04866 [Trichuris suis]|nr:hypothetical protein D918_04866 [Trichuris suis]